MNKKTHTPEIRSATSQYRSLITYYEGAVTAEGLEEHKRKHSLEYNLAHWEKAAVEVLKDSGYDLDRYPSLYRRASDKESPWTDAGEAAEILVRIDAVRRAVNRNDAEQAAWHTLRLMEMRRLQTVRAMELNFRIGEKHRRAPGISSNEQRDMQEAANVVWRDHPRLSKVKVAERIASQFPQWQADTIRKKIKRPS